MTGAFALFAAPAVIATLVTIRGPQERKAIAAKVRGVARVKELDDRLEFSAR